MKVVEKNCIKKLSKDGKRKSMAVMGEKNYILSVPGMKIEVVKNPGSTTNIKLIK